MTQTNVISPGISWYEDSFSQRKHYPTLIEGTECDVAIIGGGFTGLSAALHLAKGGVRVILVDASRFGDGASGRNGGQLGTGQRLWVEKLEKQYGFSRAKALFDLSEQAKADIMALKDQYDIEYVTGQLSVAYKKRELFEYQSHVDAMSRYGYEHMQYMDRTETADRLGSSLYYGGIRDTGTGHVQPLKLVAALANAAEKAGAMLYEKTPVKALNYQNGKCLISIENGYITAQKVLLATNGYELGLQEFVDKQVVPIRSYIGASDPLPLDSPILKGMESVDDSRFVVRYFRKSADNRLLFGGAESYDFKIPADIEHHVRKQMAEVYPEISNIKFTHIWGGTVAITMERMPYVAEVMPGVTYCGGYSGHGVMMAPFVGKLFAQNVLGKTDNLDILKDLKITKFPGGIAFRRPLLNAAMKWFALYDRF